MKRSARVALIFLLLVAPSLSRAQSADSSRTPLNLGLIEARALASERSAWVFLDARPRSAYLEGHLPGARSFCWEDYTRTDANGVPYKTRPPEELASALRAEGIDEDTAVAVYGDADKSWGGEGWTIWCLAWIGHRGAIRLLDGGIQSWQSSGLALESAEPPAALPATHYDVRPRRELEATTTELRRAPASWSLVDTRAWTEWVQGHVAGAVHIPWDEFYQGKERRPISPDALRELLRKKGVRTDRPVVYYCAGGIRSAFAWTVHELSGSSEARNYEGGMEEWKRTP